MMQKLNEDLKRLLLQQEIEQFYYYEASLLNERKFHEWLELLSNDLEYWMPIRMTRTFEDRDLEFARPGEHAYYDDNKELIAQRVKKLFTGCSWAENPPSRTRHLVNNVRILSDSEREVDISSNFHIYQSRLSNDQSFWYGRREDRLRKVNGHWLIVRRHIFLDHVQLHTNNLAIFF